MNLLQVIDTSGYFERGMVALVAPVPIRVRTGLKSTLI